MLRAILVSLALLASPAAAHEDHADHLAEAGGLRAVHAWANATSGPEAMVYLDLSNVSDAPAVLTGAQSEIAASAGLVGLSNEGGRLRFEPIPQMPIPPGGAISLSPNGLAIRLDGLTRPLAEQDRFTVTLDLAGAPLPVTVEGHSATATRHSHAGHQH